MYCLNKIFNGSSLAICLKPYAPSNALASPQKMVSLHTNCWKARHNV